MPLEQIQENLEAETEKVIQHLEGKDGDPWDKIEELEAELQDLLDENNSLQNDIKYFHSKIDELELEISTLEFELKSLRNADS